MSTNEHKDAGASAPDARKPSRKSSRLRGWLIGGAVALASLAGLGAVYAHSSPWGGSHWGGWGHHAGWHSQKFDPAFMGPRVDFGVDIILGRVGANAEQKAKVAGSIKSLMQDAPEFRRGNLEARERFMALLRADTFDREAAERLRAERIGALDEASKKALAAISEAADTLTSQQRRELMELAEKKRGMFRGPMGR